jgi:hypothetical protein
MWRSIKKNQSTIGIGFIIIVLMVAIRWHDFSKPVEGEMRTEKIVVDRRIDSLEFLLDSLHKRLNYYDSIRASEFPIRGSFEFPIEIRK